MEAMQENSHSETARTGPSSTPSIHPFSQLNVILKTVFTRKCMSIVDGTMVEWSVQRTGTAIENSIHIVTNICTSVHHETGGSQKDTSRSFEKYKKAFHATKIQSVFSQLIAINERVRSEIHVAVVITDVIR
jgi:hypothetical protein